MLNTGADAAKEIGRLPLEACSRDSHLGSERPVRGSVGTITPRRPRRLFLTLLNRVLERARPRAITLEYNWSPTFPQATLTTHIDRVRQALECI